MTHLLMGPWSISWGLAAAQNTFREECDQTGDSRLAIAGWNVGKRVAVEEGHGFVGSTNMQRLSWNSPGGSILCWRLRQGQGGVAVNPLLRWELRADSYPPTGAALSPELPPSYNPLGLDTYDGVTSLRQLSGQMHFFLAWTQLRCVKSKCKVGMGES